MTGSLLGHLFRAAATATLGLALAAPMALAQETNNSPVVNPNEGFTSPDGNDNFLESPTGAMDLIHQSVLRSETSRQEFQTQQRERLSQEAANFRQLQQQQIRAQEATAGTESDGAADIP